MSAVFRPEAEINLVCSKCDTNNVVSIKKLDSRPVCQKCHESLEITEAVEAYAANYAALASSIDKNVKII